MLSAMRAQERRAQSRPNRLLYENRIDSVMRPLPNGHLTMPRKRVRWPLLAALALAAGAVVLVPRGFDAGWWLLAQDDPVRLADRAVDERFSLGVAEKEIDAA